MAITPGVITWLATDLVSNPTLPLIGTKAASIASHSATGVSASALHQAELAKLQTEAKALGKTPSSLGSVKATEDVGRHVAENLSEPGIDPQYTSRVQAKPEVQGEIRRDFAPGQPPVRFLPVPTAAGTLIGAEAAGLGKGDSTGGVSDEALDRVIRYRPDYKEFNDEIDELINPSGVIFGVTVWTVILSACIFIAILTWLEFIRVFYDTVFDPLIPARRNWLSVWTRFSYAFFITALMIVLVYIIFRFSKEYEERHRRIPY